MIAVVEAVEAAPGVAPGVLEATVLTVTAEGLADGSVVPAES